MYFLMKNRIILLLRQFTISSFIMLSVLLVLLYSTVRGQAQSIPDSLYSEIVLLKKKPASSERNNDILTLFFELNMHYHPKAKGNWRDSLFSYTKLYDSEYGRNLSGITRGEILCQEGKFKEGSEKILFSSDQLEKTGHLAQAAFGYMRVGAATGIMQQNSNKRIEFLGYYNKGLHLANQSNQPAYQVLALGYFAAWYYDSRNFNETLKTGNQMLSIINRDKTRSSTQYLGTAYRYLGLAYLGLGNTGKAEKYLQLAKLWTRSPGRSFYVNYSIHQALAEFYYRQKDFGRAISECDSTIITLSRWKSEIKLSDAEIYLIDLYLLKYKIYKESNLVDSALHYHEKLLDQKSIYLQNELDKNYSELHEKYKVDERELQIVKLNNELLENQNDKQSLIIYSLVIFLILLGILSGLIFRSLRLNKKNAQYVLELMTVKNELSTKVIQTQETERQRLAKDLHDDLGGTLSTIKGQAANENASSETLNLIEKAIEDLRNVSRNLMPPELQKAGLAGSVHQAIERLRNSSKTEFIFISFGREVRLEADTELNIYRIIGELLNNILKHAGASKGVVQLLYYDDHLLISIEDNGVGIKTEEKNWGIGLKNINSRVEYLKAELSIDTGPYGTTVIIKVPY